MSELGASLEEINANATTHGACVLTLYRRLGF